MRAAVALSLKSRITQLLWVVNAVMSGFLALLGGAMSIDAFGFDSQLASLVARAGAVLTVAGVALVAFSLWKARSISTH